MDRDLSRVFREISCEVDAQLETMQSMDPAWLSSSRDLVFLQAESRRSEHMWRLIEIMVREKLDSLRLDSCRNFTIHSDDDDFNGGAATPEGLLRSDGEFEAWLRGRRA